MSGLEVFGAFAASSQLLAYIFKIGESLVELRDHIKNSSSRIDSYWEQLQALEYTLRIIEGNQNLHSSIDIALLKAIWIKVSALNDILRQSDDAISYRLSKRIIHVLSEKRAEKRIKESFIVLESYKLNLALCMKSNSERTPSDEFREEAIITMPPCNTGASRKSSGEYNPFRMCSDY